MEFMENRADAGTPTTSSPGVMRRWAVMPRPRLGIWVEVTPLVVMPRSVAHWRKFSWEEKGWREESMVGFWGGKEEGSSIAQRDESRSGLVTSSDFNYMVQRRALLLQSA